MKKQFEHERDDKGKKVIFFSRKSIGSRVGSSNFIGQLKELKNYE